MNILTGINMYKLQFNLPTDMFSGGSGGPTTRVSSEQVKYLILGMVVIGIAILIYNIVKGNIKINLDKFTARDYTGLSLHRITKDVGLNREQTKMLEYILISGGIKNPDRILKSPEFLDRHFKRTYRLIERMSADNDELNHRLSVLFATREIIEAHATGKPLAPALNIPEKTPAVLIVENMNYPVKVLSSHGDTLVIENPVSDAGDLVRLAKGSKVSLSIFTKSDKGISVEARVMGYLTIQNRHVMQLSHSGEIKKISKRRFQRRQITIACNFFRVQIDEETQAMTVEKERFSGYLSDISIGGCSIKTRKPEDSGQQLKIEIPYNNGIIVAIGEVVRTSNPDPP